MGADGKQRKTGSKAASSAKTAATASSSSTAVGSNNVEKRPTKAISIAPAEKLLGKSLPAKAFAGNDTGKNEKRAKLDKFALESVRYDAHKAIVKARFPHLPVSGESCRSAEE